MPRRTPGNARQEERWIARRVAWELQRRSWSYQDLADAMSLAGCPMDQSAFNRILKRTPPRQISANELAALAEVFGVSVSNLMAPIEVAISKEAADLLSLLDTRRKSYLAAAQGAYEVVLEAVRLLLDAGTMQLDGRFVTAMANAELSMINMLDLLLEAEAELRGEDFATWPDSSELYGDSER